jgi:hypothetical protein
MIADTLLATEIMKRVSKSACKQKVNGVFMARTPLWMLSNMTRDQTDCWQTTTRQEKDAERGTWCKCRIVKSLGQHGHGGSTKNR